MTKSKKGNTIQRKLTGNAGETIAETLVALLISALALVMLAGAISSGGNVITRSENVMEAYYRGMNALGTPNQPGFTVSLKTADGLEIKLSKDGTESVKYAVNDAFKSKPVLSYALVSASP